MSFCIAADIGGTNGRFCVYDNTTKELIEYKSYRCADFDTFESLLSYYLNSLSIDIPKQAVIAIATHVSSDYIEYTNLDWNFSVSDVAKTYKFEYLKFINDFTAVSLAVPSLNSEQLIQVGEYKVDVAAESPFAKAIIGAGTGLGVSGLLPSQGAWVPIQGQGGHVVYGPNNEFEVELFKYISNEYGYVSAENLLSGNGLQLLYQAVAFVNGSEAQAFSAANITSNGLDGSSDDCLSALNTFCGIFGSVASDLVLTLGARAGLYIAGGVVNHMQDFFANNENFHNRFNRKGCMTPYMEDIPVAIISDTNVGLLGALASRESRFQSLGVTYTQ